MKKYYKDAYGSTASIEEHRDGSATLRVSNPSVKNKTELTYDTIRSAKNAMSHFSDCWTEK